MTERELDALACWVARLEDERDAALARATAAEAALARCRRAYRRAPVAGRAVASLEARIAERAGLVAALRHAAREEARRDDVRPDVLVLAVELSDRAEAECLALAGEWAVRE